MDNKKSRQQYRLKGATRILSDDCIMTDNEQLSKTSPDANVDSTTSTNLFNEPIIVTAPVSNSNNLHHHQQQHVPLYMSTVENSSLASSSTSFNSQQQQQACKTNLFIPPCDIKSLFECPICFDFAVPPIYQCQNGHLVCQTCSTKITHCPTCRVPIAEPAIRNLQLDRLAETFQFPCKYNFNGCEWKSYWFKKRDHEDGCEFISYSCPCPGTTCKWTGLLSQVMPHLAEHHKSITTLKGEDIVFLATDVNLKGAVDWVMIQSCFNQNFLLVLEKQEAKNGQQNFFAVVQLIGSQKEADKFKYKLELTNQVRRLQWEAKPRSILDGIQVAISTFDCLVFDAKTAQLFLSPIRKDKDKKNPHGTSGENLGINVTIQRLA